MAKEPFVFRITGDQYIGIEVTERDTDRPGELGYFGYNYEPGGGRPSIPMMFPVVHQNISLVLGQIIAGWSLLDCFVAEAATLLVAHNGGSSKPRELETANRLRLLDKEFSAAFAGQPNILRYFNQKIITPAWSAKLMRDLIGHAQIVGNPNAESPHIRFVTKRLGRRVVKEFGESDLSETASLIHRTAGHLHQICADPQKAPLSSQDISRLQDVLVRDRWIAAIERAMQLPPRPFRP